MSDEREATRAVHRTLQTDREEVRVIARRKPGKCSLCVRLIVPDWLDVEIVRHDVRETD